MGPLRRLFRDVKIFIQCLPYLPWIMVPFFTSDPKAELYLGPLNTCELLLQGLLCLYETSLLIMALPALLILPGSIFFLVAGVAVLMVLLISWPLQGPSIQYSNMDESLQAIAQQHRDERWIFVNGCAASSHVLQMNIDRLSQIFGRAVVGIHNATYGIFADLLECIVQRVTGYQNRDVRDTYGEVKAVLLDPTVDKVVLIGHSQ